MLTTEQSKTLEAWRYASHQLTNWKTQESELRQQLAEQLFPNAKEGTNTLEIGNGWKLKLVAKTNYKVTGDERAVQNVHLQTNAIKMKPELSLAAYKLLSDAHKAIVDEVLTTSPGMPALELVEPKA